MALEAHLFARSIGLPKFGVSDSGTRPRRERGFFSRVLDALIESRQRQAEREIARMVALRGGKFTDDLDGEIGRVLGRSESSAWRA